MIRKIIFLVVINVLIFNQFVYPRDISPAEFVKDINILFLKGEYASLIRKADDMPSYTALHRKEKKEILYLMGLSHIKLENFSEARKTFIEILELKGGKFREEAYIGIADSYFYEAKFDKAIEAYEDVLTMYPKSDRLSGVYYNLAHAHKEMQESDKARYYLKQVKERYDTSFEAEEVTYITERKEDRYYIIQLGAFRKLKNAQKLVRKLRKNRYESYIQKIKKGREVIYRVRGGKFSNEYYAKRLLRRLRRDGFSAKIIME